MAKVTVTCLCGLLLIGCDAVTGPEIDATLPGQETVEVVASRSGTADVDGRLIRHGAIGPERYEQSFWAVYGRTTGIAINYAGRKKRFLEFRVPGNALRSLPDGTGLGPGDSVLITVAIDPDRYVVRFSPSGLRFNPLVPAHLTLSYKHANPDFDGDGDVDRRDRAIRNALGVWWQRDDGEPWYAGITRQGKRGKSITSLLHHFSNYTISW